MRIIKQFAKKITLSLLLSIFLFFNFFSVGFFRPIQVKAIPVEVLESAPQKTRDVWDQVQQALLSSALGSLVNAASYFTRKIAYDMAKGLADAAVGKKPAIFQQSPGDYLKDVALDTAASAIADLGVGALGINFCTPPDLNFQLNLQVGLSNIYSNEIGGGKEGPQPSCSWSKMQESWGDVKNKYSSTEIFNANLDVTQGGLGTTLVAKSNIDKLNAKSTASADAERAEGDGFKAIKDTISGKVKTPAQTVKSESEAVGAKQQGQMSASQIAGIYAVDAWQIIPTALSTFANTFVSTLANNILKDGLFPTDKDSGKESVTNPYASVLNYNRKAAESVYSYLITDIPVMNLSAYDYVTNFSVCPDNPAIDNCVFDENWQNILNRAKTGEPLTIKQAIEQGLLSGELKFYSETSEENSLKDCFRLGLCYSNLQKMRKARIIPLGFEILASKADPEKGSNITLGKALESYYDTTSEYYGLINPNWILKAPEARIKLQAYTENIIEGTNTRNKEVIDYDSCVTYDENGKCETYGYCLKEENDWDFYGDNCNEEFNTCKTFKNNSTGEINSYLSRTLEYGGCNLDSVGCSAYSLHKYFTSYNEETKSLGDFWLNSSKILTNFKIGDFPQNQVLFLNSKQEQNTCPAEADGCSAFEWEKIEYNYDLVTLETTTNTFKESVSLKKAPDYLGCYNIDTPALVYEWNNKTWPNTLADLFFLEYRPAECENYAQVCLPDEVGCSNYVSVNSGETIGGKVELENWCPNECVGYETFRQNASAFEEAVFPLYFIPSRATTCSAGFAGCDEFTRLSQAGGGSESLVYFSDTKKCELPDGENAGVFYSWEGSADSGFVLRKHDLRKVSGDDYDFINGLNLGVLKDDIVSSTPVGSPIYENDSSRFLIENYNSCNQEKYNRDLNGEFVENFDKSNCTALYDDEGNIFYRNLNKTVTVSNDCQLYRKTNSDLYKDTDISDRAICLSKGGKWQGSDCLRCYDNGFYVAEGEASENKGSCQYQTILNEANICPASANGCRLYIGNNGNNLYEVFKQDFEPTGTDATALTELKTNWCQNNTLNCVQNNVDIKPESTYVGGNSLRVVNTDVHYRFASSTLFELENQEKWFTLTFWAKGDILDLDIYFVDSLKTSWGNYLWEPYGNEKNYFTKDVVTNASNFVKITNEWREYKLGPILVPGSKDISKNLVFEVDKNGTYFIDNVKLEKVGDSDMDRVAVIKNSWKTNLGYDVPEVCDNSPLDPYPGRYLGCKSYTVNNANNTESIINLTGFAKLCRENAIGCAKLQDTYNREDEYRETHFLFHNLFCADVSGCKCENTAGCISNTEEFPANSFIKDAVYFTKQNQLSNFLSNISSQGFEIVTSTLSFAPVSDPIYMTLRQEYICDSDYIGCTKMAKETQIKPDKTLYNSYDFSEVFLINKPNVIKDNLCTDDLVGCGSYSSNNLISYFKDPILAGNTFCEYKTGIINDLGEDKSGWYKVGVGECNGGSINADKISCTSDAQCSGEGNFCENIGLIPCGILYSNASENYTGNVGICDSKNDGCTRLIDHADDDKSYYVIYNDKLTSQTASCEGKVSQEQGCILLDREEYPNKLYNSITTYDASRTAKYNLVPPKSDGSNDSNLLLKVKLDRKCSTYLACDTKTIETDSIGNKVEICINYSIGGEPLNLGVNFLNQTEYLKRITKSGVPSWYDKDYVGYSFYNKRDISNYRVIYLDETAYLVYQDNRSASTNECRTTDNSIPGVTTTVKFPDYTTKCANKTGICLEGYCILPVDNNISFSGKNVEDEDDLIKILSGETVKENLYREACKTYPEATAPFDIRKITACENLNSDGCSEKYEVGSSINLSDPYYSRTEYFKLKTKYSQVNYCQLNEETGVNDCGCKYEKIEYKDGTTDYWPLESTPNPAPGICSGLGDKSGQPCRNDADCGTGGVCNKASQKGDYYGLTGLCMEYDKGSKAEMIDGLKYYPCLTWYYSDRSVSRLDLNNFYLEAGYNPVAGLNSDSEFDYGKLFCLNSSNKASSYTYYDQRYTYKMDNNWKYPSNYEYWLKFLPSGVIGDAWNKDNFVFYEDKYYLGTSPTYGKPVSLKYKNLIEEGGYVVKDQYRLFTEWITSVISKNARVLRIDSHNNDRYWYYKNYSGNISYKSVFDSLPFGEYNDNCGAEVNEQCHIAFSFAPTVGHGGGRYGDLGTIMHPERYDGEDEKNYPNYLSSIMETKGYYADTDDDGSSPDGHFSYTHYVANAFLSPNFVSYNGNNKHDSFIYISPIEKEIKEKEISKIHLIPIKLQMNFNQASQNTLGILDKDTFTIDFNLLRLLDESDKEPKEKFLHEEIKNYAISKDDYAPIDARNSSLGFFVQYILSGDEIEVYNDTYNNTGKNKIAKRYVGYFYANKVEDMSNSESKFKVPVSATGNSEKQTLKKPSKADGSDPFYLGSETIAEGKIKINEGYLREFLAVALDFNEDGDFLGYVSRFLEILDEPDGGEELGRRFMVVAEFNESCDEYAITYNKEELYDNKIMPKTDILWSDKTGLDETVTGYKKYLNKPFGSLPYTQVSAPNEFIYYYFASVNLNEDGSQNIEADGFPFRSGSPLWAYDLENMEVIEDKFFKYFERRTDNIEDYFVAYYKLDQENSRTIIKNTEEYNSGKSPKVFGVKRDADRKIDVLGEPDNISINKITDSKTTGTFTIIGKSPYKASLNFFMYADDNQMPIKKIVLDFDDSSSIVTQNGFFKNYKPYCSDLTSQGRCTNTQITCKENSDCPSGSTCVVVDTQNFFGDSTRACFDYPRTYSKIYTCKNEKTDNSELVSAITASHCFGRDGQNCGNLKDILKNTENGLKDSDYYCYYQPKVQITDNWGYCNNDNYGIDCTDKNNLSYTKFKGYLVVLPENRNN
jgi:IS1 family transposase